MWLLQQLHNFAYPLYSATSMTSLVDPASSARACKRPFDSRKRKRWISFKIVDARVGASLDQEACNSCVALPCSMVEIAFANFHRCIGFAAAAQKTFDHAHMTLTCC